MLVHTYVIAVNSGAAPNYDAPMVALAVCKPRIRRKANISELVLAFAGQKINPYEPHTVVWAGLVKEKMTFAAYWNDARFQTKKADRSPTADNFYRPTEGGGLMWMENPVHGPEAAQRDLNGHLVLAFKPAWRFGANGPPLPASFGLRMTHGRRGERLTDLTDAEWRRLEAWLNNQTTIKTTRTRASAGRCQPVKRTRTPTLTQPTRSGRC